MIAPGMLFVMTGPSGTGKSSVVSALLQSDSRLRFSVSHTTRPARPGERDGVDYHFVSQDEFERLRASGGFVEWAEVHGHLYGTSHEEVRGALDQGAEMLLDIDVQGAGQICARFPEAVTVFVLPPDSAALEQRLRGRGTETEASLALRLKTAALEVTHYSSFRYVVVNDQIARTTEEIRAILTAERARTSRRRGLAERIVGTFPESARNPSGGEAR